MAMEDPILLPRIEAVPEVSDHALRLFKENLVWDNLMPWGEAINGPDPDKILPRFHSTGVDFVSLTIGLREDLSYVVKQIAHLKHQVAARSDYVSLVASVDEIHAARSQGKLALGLNFQETLPFGSNLENIQLFYDLGVRQALLAYNNRNLVGDGGAEPEDAGLSLYGREVVREMNRVGMLVDGSHSGYRTTMQAIDLCEGPFIFSHSNPFSVRPHYRSIRDDQMRACAATGGVVGINGVGYWVGDNDASTDAIFKCLDYTVEMIGPDHVGLGFDYVLDLDNLIAWVRNAPIMWPPYQGEEMVRHNYAGPEQMVDLVQKMLDHGYTDETVIKILGGNWERVARQVWK